MRPGGAAAEMSMVSPDFRAREGIAHLWVGALGQSGRRLAPVLGVAPQSVYRAAARGAARAAEWAPLLLLLLT